MDKQILELLTEMKEDMKSMRTDISSLKSEMNHRFDTVEAKLVGVGQQFESTNEARMNEMDFLTEKVT